jgi:hypothetical protein
MNSKLKAISQHIWQHRSNERGSTLPMVMGLGAVMMLASIVLIVQSQQGQSVAQGRTNTGNSLAIAEGGVARTLALLTKRNNAVLLTKNYDLINSNTGKTHLGLDAVLNSGDEESTAVNQWTTNSSSNPGCSPPNSAGAPNISYSGNIGSSGQYKLLAYRYNASDRTGTFLVEGKEGTLAAAYITVVVSIDSKNMNFPGVLGSDSVDLRGRTVSGVNGNVYYNPYYSNDRNLTGSAAPNSSNRRQFLNALWSGPNDNVSGTIFACALSSNIPYLTPQGATDLGDVNKSKTATNTSGQIEYYKAKKIDLTTGETLTVDTTEGPVYLYVKGGVILRGNSQIRNIRTDGKPPRVGDLRIIMGEADFKEAKIYDRACIDTAFIYNARSDVHLFGSGDGCPSSGSSNIDGVVWAEDISETTATSTSGINVPDDVSSLSDILSTVGLTIETKNQFGGVKNWQRVKL